MSKEEKYYVLAKPEPKGKHLPFRYNEDFATLLATREEALKWRDYARKSGRIKYDLFELTKIEDGD